MVYTAAAAAAAAVIELQVNDVFVMRVQCVWPSVGAALFFG